MEQLGKVYKYNYLAEVMSHRYGSVTNKHRTPENEEFSFLWEGKQLPWLSLQLES